MLNMANQMIRSCLGNYCDDAVVDGVGAEVVEVVEVVDGASC